MMKKMKFAVMMTAFTLVVVFMASCCGTKCGSSCGGAQKACCGTCSK